MGVCAEIVTFDGTDGTRLSGALFEPTRNPLRVGVIYLHGNGDSSVFRSARTNGLAAPLTEAGFAFLPFDNRGSGLMRWLKQTEGAETIYSNGGTAFERIAEARFDIDGAARFLRSRGIRRIFLAGHSTGANKVALYDSQKHRNSFSGYILLAAGDDVGIYHQLLGERRFGKLLDRAEKEIARGKEDSFIPPGSSPFPMSWGALADTINPDGDYNQFPFGEVIFGTRLSSKPLFRSFRKISKQTLVVYGSEDEFAFGDVSRVVEILRRFENRNARVTYRVIEGADHGFGDCYEELGGNVVDWMKGVLE